MRQFHRRCNLIVSAWVFLYALNAQAQTLDRVEICVQSALEQEAVLVLGRWIHAGRVEPRTTNCQAAKGYVGWFAERGTRVYFYLRTPDNQQLTRAVPWLDAADGALERLAMVDRLSAFAVIVDALLIEDRLAPPIVVAKVVKAPKRATRRRRRVHKPIPKQPAPEPEPAPVFKPEPVPEPVVLKPAPPKPGPVTVAAVIEPSKPAASTAWRASGRVGGRWRDPGFFSPILGLGGAWGPIFAEVIWQPASPWAWDERRLEVVGIGLDLGLKWQKPIGGWRLKVPLAARVERLTVRRLNLAEASPHSASDVGILSGVSISRQMIGPWRVELGWTLAWAPTARVLDIPNGPQIRFNRFASDLVISLSTGSE